MEWIEQILTKHTKEDGTVDIDAANKEIDKTFPQHAVTKNVYNTKAKEAAEAKQELDELQANSTKLEDLQQENERLSKELTSTKKDYKIEAALKEAGGKKLDYLKYRLGELELDDDGNVKDLDDKLKELQEQEPEFFAAQQDPNGEGNEGEDGSQDGSQDDQEGATDPAGSQAPSGYQVLDNKLENGSSNAESVAASEFEKALGLSPGDTAE